jgi:hypothetical protein
MKVTTYELRDASLFDFRVYPSHFDRPVNRPPQRGLSLLSMPSLPARQPTMKQLALLSRSATPGVIQALQGMVTLVLSSRWDGQSVTIFLPGTDLSCWPWQRVAIHLSFHLPLPTDIQNRLGFTDRSACLVGPVEDMAPTHHPLAPGAVNRGETLPD